MSTNRLRHRRLDTRPALVPDLPDTLTLIRRRLRYLNVCDTPSVRRERAVDAGLVVLVCAASLTALSTVYRTGLFHTYPVSCLCALLAAGSLMWRRTLPELCMALAFGATLASDEGTALIAASYAVGRYGRRHRALVVGAATLAFLSTRSLTGGLIDDPNWRVYVAVLNLVAPAFYGAFVRRQRRLGEQLRARLARAEAATDHAARFAIMEKRTRLAFEIHDTVGHHTTYLVLRAGAASRRSGLSPEVAREFEEIQEAAITVMHELRGVIGVLREGDDEADPLGGRLSCHEFLEGLARNMRAIGMDAHYEVRGTPRELGPAGEGLLYRVSRESLTNAAKYAPGAAVRIGLEYGVGTVRLAVRNGRPLQRPLTQYSGGLGHAGLRRALASAGGRFLAGPVPGGGYEVRAVIPLPRNEPKERAL
ncbi:sensor histidine kinase [Streptomyces sp. NPDC051704]|uniref:sensor histidine kinase n=1 Tax=Streptomyces sp. NPDC051704 TaxID=3365671 RepID=UPI00379CBF2E